MGGQTLATYTFDANDGGTYTLSDSAIITTSSTANLAFTPNAAFTGTVTNVSVKKITRNNAPVLSINNTSGTANLEVRASSDFDSLFMGLNSGSSQVSGYGNLAVGTFTLQNNVSGHENTALGQNALYSNTSGYANTAVGFAALNSNTSGYGNIAVGAYALSGNVQGTTNIAIGNNALQYNIDGYDNVGIGQSSLNQNTTGNELVAIGSGSLTNNTTGTANTALGYASLRDNATGYNNTTAGAYSLEHSTGNENASFGVEALRYNTIGSENTAFGTYSLINNVSGTNNTALGQAALVTNTNGTYNTALGDEADVLYGDLQSATAVGSGAAVGSNNSIILGYNYNYGVDNTVGIGTSYAPNPLTVKPNYYSTGTITQSGGSGSVVGSGTSFTSGMVGGTIYYPDHTTGTITAVADATHLTSSNTTGGWTSRNDYEIIWGGFNVKNDATLLLQPTTDSTSALQVNDSSGRSTFHVDTTNSGYAVIGLGSSSATGAEVDLQYGANAWDFGVSSWASGFYLENPSGTSVFNIQSSGNAIFKNTSDMADAFQIQNASGFGIVRVDTSTGYLKVARETQAGSDVGIAIDTYDSVGWWLRSYAGSDTLHLYNDGISGDVFTSTYGGAVQIDAGATNGTFTADIAGTATTHGICHSGTGTDNQQFVKCTTPVGADYAELYPSQPDVEPGDVIMTTNTYATSKDGKYQVPVVAKTDSTYNSNEIGVISETDPHTDETNLTGNNVYDSDHPMPVALNGRVLTKVSTENGDIAPGDYITASSTPGVGMKATKAGEVIGRAMQSYSASGVGKILVFINPFYYEGPTDAQVIQNGGSATLSSLNVTGTAQFANLNASGMATINNLTVTGNANLAAATIGTLSVTSSAQFAGDITVGGHIITSGGEPTSQAQAAAGGAASVAVDGTDTTGTITITTGSSPAAGDLAKILFSKTYGQAPHVVLSPSNDKAAGLHFYKGTTNATDFMLNALDTPQANTTYKFDYFIAQ